MPLRPRNLGRRRVALAVPLGALVLATCPVSAQYQLFEWGSFDGGKMPPESTIIGKDSTDRVVVADLATLSGMPPEFRSPEVAKETGTHGLLIKAHLEDPPQDRLHIAGLTVGKTLERDKLGETGCAIYQADFYLPPKDQPQPSIAVLAMEPMQQEAGKLFNPNSYYRFGIGGASALYFSFMEPGGGKATVYRDDKELMQAIPRPGWHRFAIVFEGRDKIRCYVDGRETSYSPVTEPKLRNLAVGIMAIWQKSSYDGFVDNLSIQFTTANTVMPVSPYSAGWTFPEGPANLRRSVAKAAATPDPVALADIWMEPTVAWQKAQSENKPLLLYFHAPGITICNEMEKILSGNAAAQEYVRRHACARVDINQLQGGKIAGQYGVFKVPTFLVVAPDAKAYKLASYHKGETWETFSQQLGGL